MSASKLKLNPDKTEFILFGSKKQRDRLNARFPVNILGNPPSSHQVSQEPGCVVCDFLFSQYVQNICKGCFIELRDFRSIRQFLTHEASVSVATAFVSSRLDYCNSLFRSLFKFNLHRLQSLQKCAARIVTNLSKYTQITLVLRKAHWLPIQFRSDFKLATLVYKFIPTGFPKYFAPHTTQLTILDIVRVLPISLMFQSFNLKFTSPLSSLASVLPLMLPLFGIHFLKTFAQHPVLPLLERSSNLSLRNGISSLASFVFSMVPTYFCPWIFGLGYCYCVVAPYSPLLSGD